MKKATFIGIFVLAIIASPVSAAEYIIGNAEVPVPTGDPNATYVGTETCNMCHLDVYEEWSKSGHKYKLMTPDEAKAIRPDMPLPKSYTWDDILYVIGGWGWKSLYVDSEGFIITKTKDGASLAENQYNWEDGSWSSYHSGEDKKYDCTKCHNTGSTYDRDHMNLSGMAGDWEERGIACEACHGPGSEHVELSGGKGVAIVVNKTAEFCGLCHVRGDNMSIIPAVGGFVQSQGQYQELINGGMGFLHCTSCHNPHKPVHNGATNPEGQQGIFKECEGSCHIEDVEEFAGSVMQKANVICNDCHMPKATKSAIKTADYVADVSTHIFRINTSADAEMFTDDGTSARGYLTLDFTCLPCHTDKDKAWAAEHAEGIHSAGKVAETHEPEKGICGPTALLLIAFLPAIFYGLRSKFIN